MLSGESAQQYLTSISVMHWHSVYVGGYTDENQFELNGSGVIVEVILVRVYPLRNYQTVKVVVTCAYVLCC